MLDILRGLRRRFCYLALFLATKIVDATSGFHVGQWARLRMLLLEALRREGDCCSPCCQPSAAPARRSHAARLLRAALVTQLRKLARRMAQIAVETQKANELSFGRFLSAHLAFAHEQVIPHTDDATHR